MGKRKSSRIAVILIAAMLISQFNVVSYGADMGSFGGDRYSDEDASVSEPVIHFTVPPKAADPVPETPDYHDVFSTPVFTPTQIPTPFQNVNPTPVPSAPVFKDPTQTIGPFPGNSNEPEADPESEPAAGTEPSPAPTPVVTITPIPTPSPLPADKPVPEEESTDNEPEDMEGIPEGIPERIRELIRQGRLRAADNGDSNTKPNESISGQVSDNEADTDNLSLGNSPSKPEEDPISQSGNSIMPDKAATIVSIKISAGGDNTYRMDVGAEYTPSVEVTTNPQNTPYETEWSVGNPSLVTIDKKTGKMKAVKAGTTTLTVKVTVDGNSRSATCNLTVREALPESIGVTSSITVYIGDPPTTITATVYPTTVTSPRNKLSWKIKNSSIATATPKGTNNGSCEIKGVSVGTTTLTVTADYNPDATKDITVNVLKRINVTGVTVNPTSEDIFVGDTLSIKATVLPTDATNQSVSWSFSPSTPTIASFVSGRSSSTCTIRGDKEGTVDVVVRTTDGGKEAKCTVRIHPVAVTGIVITSPSTSPPSMEVVEGTSETIIAEIRPSNATNKKITWTSSDTSIATLSDITASGSSSSVKVKGEKQRQQPVTITATTDDGKYTAECLVTVVPPTPVSEVNIEPKSLTMDIDQYEDVSASVKPEDATNKNFDWVIVNEAGDPDNSIIEIYRSTYTNCKIIAKKTGTARVKAISRDNENLVDYCTVTVNPMSIKLDKDTMTLEEERSGSLTATVKPSGVAYKEIKWSIDPGIATLTGNDKICTVTALSANAIRNATITATLVTNDDEEYSAECALTVNKRPVPVTGLEVDPTSMTVKLGDSLPLTWKVLPEGADETTVTLTSKDTGTATVSPETGAGIGSATVSGCSVGETDIIVTTAEGISGTCHVTVEWIQPTSVALSCDEIWLIEGETHKLDATVYPSEADDKTVSWNSADHSIATVDQSGLVTAVSEGTTIVTVVTNDGGHKAVCAVHVRRPGVDVEDITVTPSENTINIGDAFTVTAHVTPDDATDKTVIWKSNNPAVAVVRGEGLSVNATGLAAGSAVISATASNGTTAFCIVNVEKGITHVTDILIPMFETIYVGQSASIVATITPDDADDKTVIWTSEDEDIVSVNSVGRITGIKEGKGTVVARTADGGYEARCIVNVINPKPDPGIYKLYIADERKDAFHPEMVRGMVETLAGDRYLVIFDSDGAGIKPLITGDSTLEYTQALFYDMWITDIKGYPKNDFVRCTVRIPLPPSMDIHKGTVRVVSKRGDALDKTIPSSVGEEGGVAYVSFTAEHFTEYAILYKKSPEEKPETKIVYRDVPVIQYVPIKEKPKKEPAKEVKSATPQPTPTPTPTPVPMQPVVIPRILDSVPKTGDRNR